MPQYRHVGQIATKDGVFHLDHFGQAVTLPEEAAHEAILEGVSLLTQNEFEGLQFTPEELARHKSHAMHEDTIIDPEFLEKKKLAWAIVHERRQELKGGHRG